MKTTPHFTPCRGTTAFARALLLSLVPLLAGSALATASVYTTPANGGDIADTFVGDGHQTWTVPTSEATHNKNYGEAGTLFVAGADAENGEFDSLIKFTLAPAKVQFDAEFGAGNWQITGVSISLASNYGDQGEQPNNLIFSPINAGLFAVTWMSNDTWLEGKSGGGGGIVSNGYSQGVTYDSLPSYYSIDDELLGTFLYTPPGDNVAVSYDLDVTDGFMTDLAAGNDVSLLFTPADTTVSFLFNSNKYASNHPTLTVTVEQIPEPSAYLMALTGAGMMAALRLRKNRV